jgi:hypothetical protein
MWGPLAPYKAHLQRTRAEEASFEILARATSPSELEEAVESLGLFLKYPDGSWLAIRYRDSHYYPMWSSSVARDSGGSWFTSQVHFCGRFRYYRQWKEQGSELPEAFDLDPVRQSVRRLGEANTLAEARQRLVALGFLEVEREGR